MQIDKGNVMRLFIILAAIVATRLVLAPLVAYAAVANPEVSSAPPAMPLRIAGSANGNWTALHDSQKGETEGETAAVSDLLFKYRDAINTANLKRISEIYAPDAVLMGQNSPSAVGYDAVYNVYAAGFKKIVGIRAHNLDWFFARTIDK
jgi:hypothetical protein